MPAIFAASALIPYHLTCERLVNPIPIDESAPRLSWSLKAGGRDRYQTAYQILVASSERSLREDNGDLWDSGRVTKDDTLDILYAGKPIGPADTALWKVRVWDESGTEGPWSEAARWTRGLGAADWHGKWIGRNESTDPAPAPMLRKEFEVDADVQSATLFACTLGYGELRLNGRKVGDHERDPGYTVFNKRALYTAFDVAKSLRKGSNALGVMLGTGWFDVHTVAVWHFEKAPWRQSPRMLLELRIRYKDGREQTVSSDESWETSTGPIVYDSIYGGETYDARLEKPGWDQPGYKEEGWTPALTVSAPTDKLEALEMPPIRATKTLKAVSVAFPKPGVAIVDFGQNMSGHARIHVSGPRGTKVTWGYTERLDEHGLPNRKNIEQFVDKKSSGARFQTDEYVLKGGGEETWEARFTYHGFRYIEVEGFPGTPTVDNFEAVFEHTDVPSRMKFECSDPMIEKIARATDWSYLSNLQSIPTDCPQREKNGWTGDAQLAADQALFHWDSATVYRKWMRDFDDVQKENGELPGIVPTGGWGYGVGPAWDSAYVLIPEAVRIYDGNTSLADAHVEGQKKLVDYWISKYPDGIVAYGLGDWVPFKTETPPECTSTAYAYEDAKILSETLERLGRHDEAAHYRKAADHFRDAWRDRFYNPKTATVANGSQIALACGLYFNLVWDAPDPVFRNLVKKVESDGHLDFGILGAKWVTNVLAQNGRIDLALKLITNPAYPSWAWWIEQGATTLWESWPGEESRNHIMFGDVNALFIKYLAGIIPDPSLPGFKRFSVFPQMKTGLSTASATYESVRGTIACSWRVHDGKFDLDLQVPPNTSCRVFLPAGASELLESGAPIEKAVGVHKVGAEYLVSSGDYHFSGELA